jgi:hypothetical protein
MEFTHQNTTSPESSDDFSSGKEKKGKKQLPHIPVPVQIEAVRAVPYEAERLNPAIEAENALGKKKKRAKKKSDVTPAEATGTSDETPGFTKVPEVSNETATEDSTEETIEEEDSETLESEPVSKTDYLGELLVSDRARRQREQLAPVRDEQEAKAPLEVQHENNPLENRNTETILEQSVEDADEPLKPIVETAENEPAEEDEGEEEDEEEDGVSSPTASTATGAATGTATTSSRSSPPISPPPTPVSPSSVPPVPPAPVYWGGGGGYYPPAPVMAASAAPNILASPVAVPQVEVVPDRNAERRGLLTGLLVGGLIEHVRHKRRERRMEREQKAQIKQMTGEQQAEALRASEQQKSAVRKQTSLEKQLLRLKEQIAQPAELPMYEQQAKQVQQPERQAPIDKFVEKTPEDIAKARATSERIWAEKQEAIEEVQREIPNDRRIETSAWHAIEVDKKTGKAVENPTVEYGEEFKYEQHQEQLRREIEAASMASESMRERYVEPHTLKPGQNERIGGFPVDRYSNTTQPSASKNSQPSANRVQAVDVVLWGVFFVIVVIIIRILTA